MRLASKEQRKKCTNDSGQRLILEKLGTMKFRLSAVCFGQITGFGSQSYVLAVDAIVNVKAII
jgi:hypothetical protein